MSQLNVYRPFSGIYSELLSEHLRKESDLQASNSAKLIRNDILTGIEIESEKFAFFSLRGTNQPLWDYWRSREDGSLRGVQAIELYSYPLCGRELSRAIRLYDEVTAGSSPFTYRCATHYHLNVLDMDTAQIPSFMLASLAADNFLYYAGDETRSDNYNCRPMSLLVREIEAMGVWAGHIAAKKPALCGNGILNHHNRYMGVNWASLLKFGTVEFRHFPGERRKRLLYHWLNLLYSLYSLSEDLTPDEMYDLIMSGKDKFGRRAFGRHWKDLNYPGSDGDWSEVEDAVRLFMLVYRNRKAGKRGASFDALLRENFLLPKEI